MFYVIILDSEYFLYGPPFQAENRKISGYYNILDILWGITCR